VIAQGTAGFAKAARALNEAGDRELRKGVYKSFREVAKPLGDSMVASLAADMPKRGGMSARVAAAKPSIRNATTGRNPRVVITLVSPTKTAMKPLDQGNLKHPVFARKGSDRKSWRWAAQTVPAGGATRAFEDGAPMVRSRIVNELDHVIAETARKGSS
jgi:hypothetical protein